MNSIVVSAPEISIYHLCGNKSSVEFANGLIIGEDFSDSLCVFRGSHVERRGPRRIPSIRGFCLVCFRVALNAADASLEGGDLGGAWSGGGAGFGVQLLLDDGLRVVDDGARELLQVRRVHLYQFIRLLFYSGSDSIYKATPHTPC